MTRFSRRKMLAGVLPALGAAGAVKLAGLEAAGASTAMPGMHDHGSNGATGTAPVPHDHGGAPEHPGFQAGGRVDHRANGFDPTPMLRDFDWGTTRRLPSGRVLR